MTHPRRFLNRCRLSGQQSIFALCLASLIATAICSGQVTIHTLHPASNIDGASLVELQMTHLGPAPATVVLYLLINREPNSPESTPPGKTADMSIPLIELGPEQRQGFAITTHLCAEGMHPENQSCLALAIYHPGAQASLVPGTGGAEAPEILLATRGAPLWFGNQPVYSSAASVGGAPLQVLATGEEPPPGCDNPPAPMRVRASLLRWNHIQVRWRSPDRRRSLEYRVYRGSAPDVSRARPLRNVWQTETVYHDADFAARAGEENDDPDGRAAMYYYWVKARNVNTKCESDFSAPLARGSRLKEWFPDISCRGRKK